MEKGHMRYPSIPLHIVWLVKIILVKLILYSRCFNTGEHHTGSNKGGVIPCTDLYYYTFGICVFMFLDLYSLFPPSPHQIQVFVVKKITGTYKAYNKDYKDLQQKLEFGGKQRSRNINTQIFNKTRDL